MDSDIKQVRPQHVPTAHISNRTKGPDSASQNNVSQRDSGASSSVPTTDTVTVTGEAARLQELEQTLTNTSTVNSERVAELQQIIASGNYQPNAESIADKLSQLEQNLV